MVLCGVADKGIVAFVLARAPVLSASTGAASPGELRRQGRRAAEMRGEAKIRMMEDAQ